MRTELVATLKRQTTELLSDLERDKSDPALADLEAIADYIALENPPVADFPVSSGRLSRRYCRLNRTDALA